MFLTKILESTKSKYNGKLFVKKVLGMGTYIQSDGLTQSGGIVKSIWKKSLGKIANKNIKSVLILGLGGGTVAELILKKYPAAKVDGIDIDPVIVDLGKKHLGLNDIPVNIKIGDAINPPSKKYDLVIVDLYNGDKFPKKFEAINFLEKLTKNKLVVFNRLYYKEKKKEALGFETKLKKVFGSVERFFPEANIMFICK